MSAEAIELKKIRGRLVALDGAQWLLSSDGTVTFVEARTAEGRTEVARFHNDATPDEIDFFANAPHMVAFLLRLVDRAIAAARNNQAATAPAHGQGKAKNHAAEVTMKCENAGFRVFLEQKHGLVKPLTKDRAIQRVRSLLGISSRTELNNDGAAAGRWRSLRADYDAWRKAGQ